MRTLSNSKGFTLVELIAVLIILGILVAFAVPKFISINKNAVKAGIDMAVIDLNGREMKCWTEVKFNEDGWRDDQRVFDSCDYQIKEYKWLGLNQTGGTIVFKEVMIQLNRKQSAGHKPANWTVE